MVNKRVWVAGVVAVAAGLAAVPAQAGVMDFLFGSGNKAAASAPAQAPAAASKRREWQVAEFSAVRLDAREPGAAPNAHPASIAPDHLRQVLGALTVQVKGASETLFSADELAELAGPLSQAFASAGPQDDVLLLSTSRREAGVLGTPYGVTARLFVQDGALQVIVNDVRLDFVNVYRGTKVLPEFRFGSRQAASSAVLSTTAGAARRSDWVALPVGVPMPVPVTAAPGQLAPKPVVLNEPARAQAAPAAPAAVVPAPAAATRDARFFEEQEQRLRALKRLRDQNLVTEDEYQQKRRDILQTL